MTAPGSDGADYGSIFSWKNIHFARTHPQFIAPASRPSHRCIDCSQIISIASSKCMMSLCKGVWVLSPGYLRCTQGLFEVWRSKIGIHSCTLYQLSLCVPACLFLPGSLVTESRSSLTCWSCHAKQRYPVWWVIAGKHSLPIATSPVCFQYSDYFAEIHLL